MKLLTPYYTIAKVGFSGACLWFWHSRLLHFSMEVSTPAMVHDEPGNPYAMFGGLTIGLFGVNWTFLFCRS